MFEFKYHTQIIHVQQVSSRLSRPLHAHTHSLRPRKRIFNVRPLHAITQPQARHILSPQIVLPNLFEACFSKQFVCYSGSNWFLTKDDGRSYNNCSSAEQRCYMASAHRQAHLKSVRNLLALSTSFSERNARAVKGPPSTMSSLIPLPKDTFKILLLLVLHDCMEKAHVGSGHGFTAAATSIENKLVARKSHTRETHAHTHTHTETYAYVRCNSESASVSNPVCESCCCGALRDQKHAQDSDV
jgi:hypothetical protein